MWEYGAGGVIFPEPETRFRRWLTVRNSMAATVVIVLVMIVSACGSGSGDETPADSTAPLTPAPGPALDASGVVEGTVIAVEGTLGDVDSFTVRLADGSDAIFVPEDGLRFAGSAPIDHVRDHMTSGAPVRVEYTTLSDGSLSATHVGDR